MVYLLHFAQPLHHARHYVGYCNGGESLEARIERHRRGDGAKLVRAAVEAGIEFEVARTWPCAGREFERWLKRQKNTRRYCPVCRRPEGGDTE